MACIKEVGPPGDTWRWAAIGLEHPKWGPMFNSGGALLSAEWIETRGGHGRQGDGGLIQGGLIHICLYGPGTLLAWSSRVPSSVVVESEGSMLKRGGGGCVVRELAVEECDGQAGGWAGQICQYARDTGALRVPLGGAGEGEGEGGLGAGGVYHVYIKGAT